MTTLSNSIDIDAPAEEVFDVASDLRREQEWGQARRVELTSAEPVGMGSTFRAEWQGSGVVEVEYTAFDRPRRWSSRGRNPKMDTNLTGEVSPLGDGRSRITITTELVPHGAFRLLTPILVRMMQKSVTKSIADLKRMIEDQRAASPVS